MRELDSLPAEREGAAEYSVHFAGDTTEFDQDADFDRLTRAAAAAFDVPMAAIELLNEEAIRFHARQGLRFTEVERRASFCERVLGQRDETAFVVGDTATDPEFAQSRLVREEGIRFYAGAPIIARGARVGTLCVFDIVPHRNVPASRREQLERLAAVAGSLVELKEEAKVRARTAAELIKEEWRHALTLEAGKVGSWVWDIRSGEMSANDILRRMFGIEGLRAIRIEDVFSAIAEEDRPALDAALEATFEEGVDFVAEFRVRSGRWLIGRGRVYQRDAAGRPLIMMGVNIDITDARQAADHTRHLLRELNHRVKNTLAMIQSLARQTIRQSPDPKTFMQSFSGRLQTLSEAHALLSDRNWSGIGLIDLIQSQVAHFLIETPERVVLQGPDVQLPPDQALGLGLILHELSSNAVKFGALSRPGGKVVISWEETNGEVPQLNLTWTETGGPPVEPPKEQGFGSQLIRRSLDKILNSQVVLDYPRSGVQARIALPLN